MFKVTKSPHVAALSATVALSILAGCANIPSAAPTAAPLAPATEAAPAATNSNAGSAGNDTGELVIYTSRAESLFKPVLDEFKRAYPNINVTLLTGAGGELAARILEERANPKADVFLNTDTLSMQSLAAEGVLAPNSSKAVMALPEAYRADDGRWAALTLRLRVIMYNTNLVKPEELPNSLLDLTDPKWKGQVGAANSTNDSIVANIAAMRHLLGDEKTEAFIKGLIENETTFFGGHTDVRKAVGAGELKLGFVNHYYYHLSKAEGAPVGVIYPDQADDQVGMVINSTNIGIMQDAPHASTAQTFVDFMLSPAGQRIFAEKNFEYPIVPDVPLAEGVASLNQFRLADLKLKTIWEELQPTKDLIQKTGLP
jgi:iron(III) transport system substrate-binding protein